MSHFIYWGIGQSIATRSLTTLQSIELSLYSPSAGSNAIPQICAELQVLQAASNLRHISIYLSLRINYRFPIGVLLALDRLLTGSGFPRLGSVGLYLSAVVARDRRGEGREFKSAMEAVIGEEFIGLSQSADRTFESSVTVRDLLYF